MSGRHLFAGVGSLYSSESVARQNSQKPYSGHSALMGNVQRLFQDANYVLRMFGKNIPAARQAYRGYVEKGIARGRRPELVGGGLIRSAGVWSAVNAMHRAQDQT